MCLHKGFCYLINVTYLDHMGTDLTVVNAARVSMSKKSEWELHPAPWSCSDEIDAVESAVAQEVGLTRQPYVSRPLGQAAFLSARDEGLIRYLVKHNHFTPFTHCFITFLVRAPIFVARQLWKSHIGVCGGDYGPVGWNETSRRYVDDPPTFFTPNEWRGRAENVKQGSAGAIENDGPIYYEYGNTIAAAATCYDHALKAGVCPEQARMALPQSMETEWYWSGTLAAFSRICGLRLDSHAQAESQEVAKLISGKCSGFWPVSWRYLTSDPLDLMSLAELTELQEKLNNKIASLQAA